MTNAATPSSLIPAGANAGRSSIAVIGAGTMGRVLAAGITRSHAVSPDKLWIADRRADAAERLARELGARQATVAEACRAAGIVLLCVKPADLPALLHTLAEEKGLAHIPLVVSIAAGIDLATIEAALEPACPVIRAMPNTPCSIGRGMTVLAGGRQATVADLTIVEQLFASVGRCLVLQETQLDAVTALAASGPAFIYLILEALADGGVMCGLPRKVATELAAQMTAGAADMVLASGRHPAELRDEVTTPGGCTIAGLLALEDRQVRSALAHAVRITRDVAAGLGKRSQT